jgi:hypothetical protein
MLCKKCVSPIHDAHRIGVLFGSPEQTISGLRLLLNKEGFHPVTFLRFIERIAEEAGLSFDMKERLRDQKYDRHMSRIIYKIHKHSQKKMSQEDVDTVTRRELRELMEREGLNQKQLALKLGVSEGLVSRCVRGESKSLFLANKIRETFSKKTA